MEVGYISARVYTSDAELPIEGAVFTITMYDDVTKTKNLIGMRITDENGKTTPIEINTPNSSLSQQPGNPQPYTTVDIRVDHPDFETLNVDGVQVFAGKISVQSAPMIPTTYDINYKEKSNTFNIEPNNLM